MKKGNREGMEEEEEYLKRDKKEHERKGRTGERVENGCVGKRKGWRN